jgi:hypothetical protein
MATKKGPTERSIPVKMELLSDEDKKALRAEAKASLLADMKQDARDEYFARALKKLRREQIPAEQIVNVSMDLAPFLPHVMLDGVMYFHGYAYDVPRSQAIVLYEQMQRSWMHQDEIEGRSRFNSYRRPQQLRIGPRDMGTTTAGANGPVVMPADMEI